MRMNLRYLSGLMALFAGLILTAGWAQENRPVGLNIEFTLFSSDRLKDLAYVQLKVEARSKPRPVAADFEIIPVRVNSQGRSDVYRFTAPAPIRFVRTEGSGDSLVVKKVLATWQGPKWSGQSLITLVPNGADSLSLHAFDDSRESHRERQVRFLNLSGVPIAGVLGRDSFTVGPALAASAPRSVSKNLKVGVTFERFGKAVPVFDQSLSVNENERLLLVFLPPFREGADVRTRVVRDQFRAIPEND